MSAWLLENMVALTVVGAMAVVMHGQNLKKNPIYVEEFTERRAQGGVLHPGNAWSSGVYAILGCLLLWNEGKGPLIWCRSSEGATLLWFAWLSFSYHASECYWTGALDITLVIHLCVSCLAHALLWPDLICVAIAWMVTCSLLASVWTHVKEPAQSVPVKYMMPLLTPLVLALLTIQALGGSWWRFSTFGFGFAVKLMDRWAAGHGVRTGVANGTSIFHLLTGVAMYLHYEEMLM